LQVEIKILDYPEVKRFCEEATDAIDSLRARVSELEAELLAVRQAYEKEHSAGGAEPESALTCMLLALKQIRDQKQQTTAGLRALIAERDAWRAKAEGK